jgi:hypothetical protein
MLACLAGDRDLAPGQGRELGVQAGLVALDGEQVVRVAPGQVVSVAGRHLTRHLLGCGALHEIFGFTPK